MNDNYHTTIAKISLRLTENIELMDIYAKYEITERDSISEDLLFAESTKALDRAVKKLNEAHRKSILMGDGK